MSKKILIAFDGTWDMPDQKPEVDGNSNTNVVKFYDAISAMDENGIQQIKYYISGVGTKWYDRLPGGLFGVGLTEKILEGYTRLSESYEEGDEVFIIGFSRGAYSARSLVGMIRNVGLLKKKHLGHIKEANDLYRTRDSSADTENAIFFRKNYSREISIQFLGVWDTVGSLGVPFKSWEWFNHKYYEFHDTELSGIVRNAFHAVAIDEHRADYVCSLWDPVTKPNQIMKQVWFCGAHANVGGGYANNTLSDIPLHWMVSNAMNSGLKIDLALLPSHQNMVNEITDSFKEFLNGAYSLFNNRFFRVIGRTVFGDEMIDFSVKERVVFDRNYRPNNQVEGNLSGDYVPIGKIR